MTDCKTLEECKSVAMEHMRRHLEEEEEEKDQIKENHWVNILNQFFI